MAKKKNYDVKMIAFNNGVTAISQYVSVDSEFITIMNPVMLENDSENQRINMNPMLRMCAKDTDVNIPVANVDLIYVPTDGLIEEYISVFIEETKEGNNADVTDETEVKEEETVGA